MGRDSTAAWSIIWMESEIPEVCPGCPGLGWGSAADAGLVVWAVTADGSAKTLKTCLHLEQRTAVPWALINRSSRLKRA